MQNLLIYLSHHKILRVDPRGKSSIRGAGARIPTGDVAEVRGTKRMLAEKKKTAKWY